MAGISLQAFLLVGMAGLCAGAARPTGPSNCAPPACVETYPTKQEKAAESAYKEGDIDIKADPPGGDGDAAFAPQMADSKVMPPGLNLHAFHDESTNLTSIKGNSGNDLPGYKAEAPPTIGSLPGRADPLRVAWARHPGKNYLGKGAQQVEVLNASSSQLYLEKASWVNGTQAAKRAQKGQSDDGGEYEQLSGKEKDVTALAPLTNCNEGETPNTNGGCIHDRHEKTHFGTITPPDLTHWQQVTNGDTDTPAVRAASSGIQMNETESRRLAMRPPHSRSKIKLKRRAVQTQDVLDKAREAGELETHGKIAPSNYKQVNDYGKAPHMNEVEKKLLEDQNKLDDERAAGKAVPTASFKQLFEAVVMLAEDEGYAEDAKHDHPENVAHNEAFIKGQLKAAQKARIMLEPRKRVIQFQLPWLPKLPREQLLLQFAIPRRLPQGHPSAPKMMRTPPPRKQPMTKQKPTTK